MSGGSVISLVLAGVGLLLVVVGLVVLFGAVAAVGCGVALFVGGVVVDYDRLL
ncbi:MAG: hypothetical protein KAG66_19795 [Methylococcales bacterium]|nr:hypothetical protein [Methylococcales bacterium]